MLWVARTGAPWRGLPERFPNWRSVYTHWRRWVQRKVWARVHLLTDALGYPVRFVVTGSERNEVTHAPALLPPGQGATVLCDRGYDADWWRERPLAAGHQPVLPGRRHRLVQPEYDEYLYRSRHLIENAFARLKSSRRIATRYEQTVTANAAFVVLACVCLWLM